MGMFRREQEGAEIQPDGNPPATDLFRTYLKEFWAPVLRANGLKGSGRVFLLPDELDWAMVGFQSSTSSGAERVKFTLNLLVAGKAEYAEARKRTSYLSERPSPTVIGGPHRYLQRVGHLTHGKDHWWEVRSAGGNDAVIDEINHVLEAIVVPKLREQIADKSPGPRGTFENVRRGS